MKKIFKKLLPIRIKAVAYILHKQAIQTVTAAPYDIQIFNAVKNSGIQKIDARLNSSNSCYAVYIDGELAHTTWLFKKKLLTKQLGEYNVYTAGDALTNKKYRGQGIYTQVLKKIAADADRDIIIYAEPVNLPSVKGIEKAGFKKKYAFDMLRCMGVKIWCRKYADNN